LKRMKKMVPSIKGNIQSSLIHLGGLIQKCRRDIDIIKKDSAVLGYAWYRYLPNVADNAIFELKILEKLVENVNGYEKERKTIKEYYEEYLKIKWELSRLGVKS
jgi:hypothetical protein